VRPAIVLDEFIDGRIQVISGSTQAPRRGETDFEFIERNSPRGRAFKLGADTWFKKTFIGDLDPNAAKVTERTPATCPSWSLFVNFQAHGSSFWLVFQGHGSTPFSGRWVHP
jgi:hypothetical protein